MSPEEKLQFKFHLKAFAEKILQDRLDVASAAMQSAQESANSEGKSSAGDKYETARAMGQLDRDMNARQMEEARKELSFLHSIEIDKLHPKVKTGSFVRTSKGDFFIGTGLGILDVDGQKIGFLSPASPMASALAKYKKGERVKFNNTGIDILEVF